MRGLWFVCLFVCVFCLIILYWLGCKATKQKQQQQQQKDTHNVKTCLFWQNYIVWVLTFRFSPLSINSSSSSGWNKCFCFVLFCFFENYFPCFLLNLWLMNHVVPNKTDDVLSKVEFEIWKGLKAILRDVMREEKFYFSLFFIIYLCNDPCCHRI